VCVKLYVVNNEFICFFFLVAFIEVVYIDVTTNYEFRFWIIQILQSSI
jgi:hypothetical protein